MALTREVMVLEIGQTGLHTGQAFWDMICAEHGIYPDGGYDRECCPDGNVRTMFSQTSGGTLCPRAFCIDTDPATIDSMRTGGMRSLYNHNFMMSSREDTGGSFGRGYNHYGGHFCLEAKERLRRISESCDHLEGFLVMRSLAGGTGSGFSAAFLERIRDDYRKRTIVTLDVLPGECGGGTVDPINVCLGLHHGMDYVDVSFLFDNQAMFKLTRSQLGVRQPSYSHVNELLATVASQFTSCLRFTSDMSMTLNELQTNLVPLPRLKFVVAAYSPVLQPQQSLSNTAISTLVNGIFSPQGQMVDCSRGGDEGRYVSAVLFLRGDFVPNDVNSHLSRMTSQRSIRFLDWSPPSVKYSLCSISPMRRSSSQMGFAPRSVAGALNHTAIKDVLGTYVRKFKRMLGTGAYMHHYLEDGMEMDGMRNAKDNLLSLNDEYLLLLSDSGLAPQPTGAKPKDLTVYGKPLTGRNEGASFNGISKGAKNNSGQERRSELGVQGTGVSKK